MSWCIVTLTPTHVGELQPVEPSTNDIALQRMILVPPRCPA